MVSPEIAHALKVMQPGAHSVLIYDSKENKRDVLFSHLRSGLADSRLVYVCSQERPEEIRRAMQDDGIDAEGLERRDRLTISNYDQVYIKNGAVDTPGIIEGFTKLAWASTHQGFRSMRGAGEMSCFFTVSITISVSNKFILI